MPIRADKPYREMITDVIATLLSPQSIQTIRGEGQEEYNPDSPTGWSTEQMNQLERDVTRKLRQIVSLYGLTEHRSDYGTYMAQRVGGMAGQMLTAVYEQVLDLPELEAGDVAQTIGPNISVIVEEITSGFDAEARGFVQAYRDLYPLQDDNVESLPEPEKPNKPSKESLPYHQQMEELRNYKPPEPEEKNLRKKYKSLKRYYW